MFEMGLRVPLSQELSLVLIEVSKRKWVLLYPFCICGRSTYSAWSNIDPLKETTLIISAFVNVSRSSKTRAKKGLSRFIFTASIGLSSSTGKHVVSRLSLEVVLVLP